MDVPSASPEGLLQQRINAEYSAGAAHYEDEPAHTLSAADAPLWQADWDAAGGLPPAQTILDVGCGTGAFSRWLAAQGHSVCGLDPASGMIERAQQLGGAGSRLRYVCGDGEASQAFEAASFDAIVSRQAVCYLPDPLAAFGRWHHWLKPGGRVMLIDGLWSRSGWGDDALVDARPLSCVQTRALLPYLLTHSGFEVTACEWLSAVNARYPEVAPRYIVAARRGGD